MNISIIGTCLNLLSGSGKAIFQLADSLAKTGMNVRMLSDKLGEPLSHIHATLLKEDGFSRFEIKRTENIVQGLLKGNKIVISAVKEFLKNAEVIVCPDYLFSWLLKRRNIDQKAPIIFIGFNNLDFKLRYLIKSGGLAIVNVFKRSFYSKLLLRGLVLRNILSHFDGIVTSSKYVKNCLDKYGLKIPVTYLGIGVNVRSDPSSIPWRQNSFLYLGWGSGIRGTEDVIKAFELYRSKGLQGILRVYLQGQHGFEERILVRRIRNSRFYDSIELGFFCENIDEVISSSKAVILPFRIPFGYSQPPLTVLEAMALKRTVISTNVGCIPEIITDNVDGLLVDPGKPREIADILVSLDDDKASRIGEEAYNKIKEKYNWDRVVEKYIQAFSKVAGK